MILVSLLAAALGIGVANVDGSRAVAATCRSAQVHYTPYPGHATGLSGLPWVRASSRGLGLVGLLWYWPSEWRTRHVARALIFPRGVGPDGGSTKIMWAFLSPKASRTFKGGDLIVRGRRLDGRGTSLQRFEVITYAGQDGAPSYASIISLPSEGCWRLQLSAGGLDASVVLKATPSQ